MKYIIIRYGEIWLKGQKRNYFEEKLIKNIIYSFNLAKHPYNEIIRKGGRILIESESLCDSLKRISGIVSYSLAEKVLPDLNSIKKHIEKNVITLIKEPFCVRVQRIDKVGKINSKEMEKEIGSFIVEKTNKKVNLKNPSTTLGIEIFSESAYLFTEELRGLGGLPQNNDGHIAIFLRIENDLIAAKMLIKRGCILDILDFELNKDLLKELQTYSTVKELHTFPKKFISKYDFIASGENIDKFIVNKDKNTPLFIPQNKILYPLEGLVENEIVYHKTN